MELQVIFRNEKRDKMLDIIVVSLIVVVLSYGLFKQTQKTIGLSKNENQSKKRV